jgi:Flp pilus assembly protein TadD/DNA-binding response OmpR family regulator
MGSMGADGKKSPSWSAWPPPPASTRGGKGHSIPPAGHLPSRRPRRSGPPGQQEVSILIVGATEALLEAMEPAFARHHIYAETSSRDTLVGSVVESAPDLVLLAGDAAREGGKEVLTRLSMSPLSSVTPVVILGDDTALDTRLAAFRHGAAAVIPHSASVDAIAERIARLAREIPERGGAALGEIGEATLAELVTTLEHELRSGILSIHAPGSEEEAVRLVLGAGRPLSDVIDDFVSRVRRHVVIAEPLQYEFDERAGGTIQLLGADEANFRSDAADVAGLRIVVADDDTARSDAVTQDLRKHGVTVVVTDLDPSDLRFARIRQIDPAILIIGEKHAQGAGYELMRRMRKDTRLRWASLLVVRWEEVWTERSGVPAIERILGTLATLAEAERSARQRADAGIAFDTRLEIVGPARLLRALGEATRLNRVHVLNPRIAIEVDISDGLIIGARAQKLDDGTELAGPVALSALLVLSSGRVHVEPVANPAVTNIMSTLDVALNMADQEPAPIVPSLPIPAASPGGAPPQAADKRAVRPQPAQARSPLGWIAAAGAGVLLLVLVAGGALLIAAERDKPSARPEPLAASAPPAAPSAPLAAPPTPAQSSAPEEPAAPAAQAEASAKEPPPEAPPAEAAEAKPPSPPPLANAVAGAGLTPGPTCDDLLGKAKAVPGTYPGAAYNELRAARKALVRGDLDEAQRCYCRAVRYDKSLADAHVGLARLLLLRRDAVQATEWGRKAAEIAPGNDDVQAVLGDIFALRGEEIAARTALLAAAGIGAGDEPGAAGLARRMLGLGHSSMRQRDHANAERYFRRAAVLNPGSWDAVYGIAHALLEAGKSELAVFWARRAVELAPGQVRTHVLLGDVLTQAGDRSGAEKAWRKALEVSPNDPEARFRVARLGN